MPTITIQSLVRAAIPCAAVAVIAFGCHHKAPTTPGGDGSFASLRVELPCGDASGATNCTCDGVLKQNAVPIEGDAMKKYSVKIHVRGVSEGRTYSGGQKMDQYWYKGGTPGQDGWNVWKLSVGNPADVYYLNATDVNSAACYLLDYTETIVVSGLDSLSLSVDSEDNLEHANLDDTGGSVIPPGVPPAPNPFNGQFIQVDFVSATPM